MPAQLGTDEFYGGASEQSICYFIWNYFISCLWKISLNMGRAQPDLGPGSSHFQDKTILATLKGGKSPINLLNHQLYVNTGFFSVVDQHFILEGLCFDGDHGASCLASRSGGFLQHILLQLLSVCLKQGAFSATV